jgi:PadR family transcriptional regulator PadR
LVLKTLEALGPLHGYLTARRIEPISGNQLAMNQGTLYPALLKLEQPPRRSRICCRTRSRSIADS